MIANIVYSIPLFGWMVRDAAEGRESAKVLFLINIALVWLIAIVAFGYPAIILPALCAVPAIFVALILLTAGK